LNCEQTNSHPWDGYALAIWSMTQTTWSFSCEKTWIATPCLPRVWERVRQNHATDTDLRFRVSRCFGQSFGAWCFGECFGAHGALACESVKMLRQMEIRLCVNCDWNRGQEMRC
jgi:hypothetical protein